MNGHVSSQLSLFSTDTSAGSSPGPKFVSKIAVFERLSLWYKRFSGKSKLNFVNRYIWLIHPLDNSKKKVRVELGRYQRRLLVRLRNLKAEKQLSNM